MINLAIAIFLVTGYCNDSCGKLPSHPAYAIMANGEDTHWGAIACPEWLDLGDKLIIRNQIFTCKDRGEAINGKRLDIWFPTCEEALVWGRVTMPVILLKEESWLASQFGN